MSRRKRNICEVHDEIRSLAEDLEKDLNGKVTKKSIQMLRRIQKIAEEAKESGQAMEDRLNEYKDGIESIGFNRNKRR